MEDVDAHGNTPLLGRHGDVESAEEGGGLASRIWDESKKLWIVVGPAIFARIALNTTTFVSQAFAGHLGDLELAAMSITSNVILGFTFGLMLGLASSLETLGGQAYGSKRYHMLGIYLQRSWIVLFSCAVLLTPTYLFATPILKLIGQPDDIAVLAGTLSKWSIPNLFSLVFLLPLTRFLQCQQKNYVQAMAALAALVLHIFNTWFFVTKMQLGVLAATITLSFTWWVPVICMFVYITCGGCPLTWNGFSILAFNDLWSYFKLSASSGVMMCLENWYYRILIIMTGNLENVKIAVDALTICTNISNWELMIPMGFFAGTGVRVANELGAGNGKGAKFATVVSVVTSSTIGFIFFVIIISFNDKIALLFTTSEQVLDGVQNLKILLAFAILLNSVQPILSGVAVGSGWQSTVAFVNLGSYYMIGVPFGILLGLVFNLGIKGIWSGMICGTLVQTLILSYITSKCDWDREAREASNHGGK